MENTAQTLGEALAHGELACTRRKIFLTNRAPGVTVGWLEDDSHHFGVTVVHENGVVREVRGAAPRYPWLTCAQAPGALRELEGKPLIRRVSDFGGLVTMRQQCTHLFELTALVCVHAAKARDDILYAATVTTDLSAAAVERPEDLPSVAWLTRNGEEVLRWEVRRGEITTPERFAGRGLLHGFRAWTEALSEDDAEIALILRRGWWLRAGWWTDLDQWDDAEAFTQQAACFSFQPQRRPLALRQKGSRRRYATDDDAMLALRDQTP